MFVELWEKIARASPAPQPPLLQWHHRSQFHPRSLFQATVSVCACTHTLCTWLSKCTAERETQACSLCNSVCEATNTHLYDNFLFTVSKDSNTDTIHFPFINWCGNVGPGRSDFSSRPGLWGRQGLFYGWEEKAARVGVDGFGSQASVIDICQREEAQFLWTFSGLLSFFLWMRPCVKAFQI